MRIIDEHFPLPCSSIKKEKEIFSDKNRLLSIFLLTFASVQIKINKKGTPIILIDDKYRHWIFASNALFFISK